MKFNKALGLFNVMKNTKLLLAFICLTTFIVGFTASDDWFLFETKEYKVTFPKKPTSETKVINSAIGALSIDIHMYNAEKDNDDNLIYGVMETEYPDTIMHSDKKEILEGFFRNSIDGAVKNVHGKLMSETIIEKDGYPGREIKIDFKDGVAVIKMRFFLVKNKMFIIQTITETKKDFNKSINQFMDSFTLIN